MAELLSCWFIIQNVLIPNGFRKWHCLSYFIHPLLLVFCQIYLWVRFLALVFSIILFYPLKGSWYILRLVFKYLKAILVCLVFLFRSRSDQVELVEEIWYDVQEDPDQPVVQNMWLLEFFRVQSDRELVKELEVHVDFIVENEDLCEHTMEEVVTAEPSLPLQNKELQEKLEVTASCGEEEEEEDQEQIQEPKQGQVEEDCRNENKEEKKVDEVYSKYAERMRYFDLLNQERAFGMSGSILNNNVRGSSYSRGAQNMFVRSMEIGLEQVYVGQASMSWEALQHQYWKVEALALSNSIRASTYDNIDKKFQQFKILLERFMENERINQGVRFLNYAQSRSSCRSLLQVPEVAGTLTGAINIPVDLKMVPGLFIPSVFDHHLDEKWEGIKGQEIFAREAMNVIEGAIKTFQLFVLSEVSRKKSFWKPRDISNSSPQVEDPKDLGLLFTLKRELGKKELELEGARKKQRWWPKRAEPIDKSHELDILFASIDVELVGRVLKMLVLSTEELKWCQEKLNSVEIREGKVTRSCSRIWFPH